MSAEFRADARLKANKEPVELHGKPVRFTQTGHTWAAVRKRSNPNVKTLIKLEEIEKI